MKVVNLRVFLQVRVQARWIIIVHIAMHIVLLTVIVTQHRIWSNIFFFPHNLLVVIYSKGINAVMGADLALADPKVPVHMHGSCVLGA